ncbi:response regulator [Paenibacillus aquistagni]|uniref:response regulator n=1 Tax=Paenibacillus aquistagni TaxID=1852522 RepID=UPI00145BA519|nr:response regulator [Paenibacillus aquistagni]NMM52770.1 response regulator [Paenibacillus aquistagni]
MIRAILIDDEQLALTSLERKIHKFQGIQCIASYTDPNQALVDLSSLDADVAFVDIEMYDISGIELAEKLLAVKPKLHIVFVTAHAEYAVEAFELNSIDYLLKPVTSKRLEKTMSRLLPAAGPVVENHMSSSREQTLRVLVFHDFQAWYGDHLLSFKTAKVKELFAYFVMHRNTSIHRDVLIEALFG